MSLRALDFAAQCARAAEGLFLLLGRNGLRPRRELFPLIKDIRLVLSEVTTGDLLSILYTAGPCAARQKSRVWLVQLSALAAGMFRNFVKTGRDKVLQNNFLKWMQEDMPQDGGFAFNDCYLEVAGANGMVQKTRGPHRNCYTSIPISLSHRPSIAAIRRMNRFVFTTFHNKPEHLRYVLAKQALVLHRVKLPEVIDIVVGPGADGKVTYM